MTIKHITDPASLQRQGMLLAAFEEWSARWEESARLHVEADMLQDAEQATRRAIDLRVSACVIRKRLVEMSALAEQQPTGLADVLARLPDDKFAQLAPTDSAAEDEPAESCPLPECSCWLKTGGPPPAYQAHPTPVCRDVPETVAWLREHQAERWYRYPLAVLEKLARWLLDLRAACWSGRWLP